MKLADVLKDKGIQFFDGTGNHHCRPGWLQLDCPYCGKKAQKFHLGYNKNRNYFVCWKCGGLPLVRTVSDLLDITYGSAKALLEDVSVDATAKVVKKGKLKLPKNIGDLQKQHIDYLRSRGFDWKVIRDTWKVQGIGLASKLKWRLFIPITYRNEVVSWTTRSIGKSKLRYMSASEEDESISHKTLLYGADYTDHACICVEGPLDVWAVGPGAVGVCGTGFSRAQVLKLSQYPVRAICFDAEPIAQKRANRLADMLSVFPGETYNITLDSGDPAEASAKEIRNMRKAVGI